MYVQPYLMFDGRAEEAIAFYNNAVGAEVEKLLRFKDAPDQSNMTPANAEKVMHCALRIGDTQILVSDGYCANAPSFQGFALTFTAANVSEAQKIFDALSDDGEVRMPMAKTFFSPSFGMLADKFGVGWMVIADAR